VDFLKLTEELCAIPTGIVCDGNETLFARIHSEVPLEIHRYPSGQEFNGWAIPHKWTVQRAIIKSNGRVIYDGKSSPLGVAHYSRSFLGALSLDELKPHLFSRPDMPTAITYHCSWLYQPWREEWGFCLPYNLVKSLENGLYEVDLRTTFESGLMLLGVASKLGKSNKTIVFNTNNCHPHMASDGFAGTAVLIRLFQWLSSFDTHYSYKLLIAPEHYGSVFYLRDRTREEIRDFVGGVFAEMLGNKGPFVVASTFNGDTLIDRAFKYAAKRYAENPRFVGFRETAGNDETVWEAPGYEVPFVQVARSNDRNIHYPEYHTDLDNADLMNPDLLAEAFNVFKKAIQIIESNFTITRKFNGLISLSNPMYNLYISRVDPAVAPDERMEISASWGYLQDCLPRYFDGRITVLDIAERHNLDFFELLKYLELFREKNLVEFGFKEIDREQIVWV